jgi:hypothetical protein
MPRPWPEGDEITKLLENQPDHVCDLVMELRELVLTTAPEATETFRWKGLCYYKAYEGGIVKGSVCQIAIEDDCVHLAFIHGAFLPDPDGLLQGDRKAKRYIPIRSPKDIRRAAFKKLIRAAVDYKPG